MEMICPECQGMLVRQGEGARCATCGAQFQVLFPAAAISAPPPLPVSMPAAAPPPAPIPSAVPAYAAPPAAIPDPSPAAAEVAPLTTTCPGCGVTLKIRPEQEGKRGKCRCGAIFTAPARVPEPVVFDNPPAATALEPPIAMAVPAPAPNTSVVCCAHHPWVAALYACARCHAYICQVCAAQQADGSQLCPVCAAQPMPGVVCRYHPGVQAARHCRKCRAPMCDTCDFSFPGNIHLCPNCATSTAPGGVPRGRRVRLGWAIALAIWCTLGTVIFFMSVRSVSTQEEAMVAGVAGWILAGIPSLIGMAVGLSCLERNLRNTPLIWGATVWNMVNGAVWILVIVVGLMRR